MSTEFNWQEFIEELDFEIMSTWVAIKDDRRELREQGKLIEPHMNSTIETLNTVLELFHDKYFKEGLSLYIKWFKVYGISLSEKDFTDFKKAIKYLEMDLSLLDGIRIK